MSGGSPPRDNSMIGIIIILLIENDDLSVSWCEYIMLFWFMNMKIGLISNEYIDKYMIAVDGI